MGESNDRDILNLEEAAALLGVSVKTFNKVLHGQSIPGRKIGREWKFSRQALIDWVGAGRSDQFYKETGPESEAGARGDAGAEARRTQGWHLELD